MAGKQAFLSDEWFTAVGAAIAEHGEAAAPPGPNVLMNLVVTGTPFGDREFHMGARDGSPLFGAGPPRRRRRHPHHRLRDRHATSSSPATRPPGCRRSWPAR